MPHRHVSSRAHSRQLPGLTLRGWVLVFAGLVMIGVGQWFALADLTRLGLLLLVLPLLTWLLGLGASRSTQTRLTVEPSAPVAGDELLARLDTRSSASLPGQPVGLHLPVHETWGGAQTLGTTTLDAEGTQVEVPLRPLARGRYEVGPLLIDRSDPFGLTHQALTRSGEPVTVAVAPRPVDHPARQLQRVVRDSTQRTTRMRPSTDTVDATHVREYSRGDDIRRIHWRSSARTGELMVRQDDSEPRPSLVIVLDEAADWGEAPAGSSGPFPAAPAFEGAVRVAATLARSAQQVGLEVRLLCTGSLAGRDHGTAVKAPRLAELLSAARPVADRPEGLVLEATRAASRGSYTVLLTAGTRADEVGELGERHPPHGGFALLARPADEAAANDTRDRGGAAHALRRGGWQVMDWPVDPGASLTDDDVVRAMDLLTRSSSRGDRR